MDELLGWPLEGHVEWLHTRHVESAAAENLDNFRFSAPVVAERAPFFCGTRQHQTHRRK